MKEFFNKIPLINEFYTVLSSPIDLKELRMKEKQETENNIDNDVADQPSYEVSTLIANRLIGESIRRNSQRENLANPSF